MKIAACVFARDEARDIAEWIAYQIAIGFDSVLVYDNGSVDDTPSIVRQFGARHDVRLLPWPCIERDAQGRCYRDCIARFASEFDWISFTDADEFIVPRAGDVRGILAGHPLSTAAVVLNWAFFGSSGYASRPPGLLTETFTRRAPDTDPDHRIIKSIVRGGSVIRPENPHTFLAFGDTRTASGSAVEWLRPGALTTVDYSVAQLNHYFTKSRAEWDRKMDRGYRDSTVRDREKAFLRYDRNEVADDTATRFAPVVRRILDRVHGVNAALHSHVPAPVE